MFRAIPSPTDRVSSVQSYTETLGVVHKFQTSICSGGNVERDRYIGSDINRQRDVDLTEERAKQFTSALITALIARERKHLKTSESWWDRQAIRLGSRLNNTPTSKKCYKDLATASGAYHQSITTIENSDLFTLGRNFWRGKTGEMAQHFARRGSSDDSAIERDWERIKRLHGTDMSALNRLKANPNESINRSGIPEDVRTKVQEWAQASLHADWARGAPYFRLGAQATVVEAMPISIEATVIEPNRV